MREHQVPVQLLSVPCPEFTTHPWQEGVPLKQRKVALISTAGLMHKSDRPFSLGHVDYRIIDTEAKSPLVMTHVSTNFDRSGFVQDHNLVLPLDRLNELAAAREIGSVARYHYSFMGATEPEKMEPAARLLAQILARDEVDLALLIPV
ncbi:MAG: glycine/sarcosine/betaine reductase selenoprotein B family protein [Gammaproteobacteria bacterium]|nr:glycine/sarcosine/betaine reductase selenoprotein B family protein [Gammaproteobacteria bacterium]